MVIDDLKSWSHSGSQSEGIFYFVFHHLPHIMHLPRAKMGFPLLFCPVQSPPPKVIITSCCADQGFYIRAREYVLLACLLAFMKTLRLHPGGAESGAPMQGTGTCIWVLPEKRQKKDNCNSQSDSVLRAWPAGKSSRRGVNCPNKLKIWRKQRTTFPPSIPHAQQTHRIQGTGLFRKSKEYFLSY